MGWWARNFHQKIRPEKAQSYTFNIRTIKKYTQVKKLIHDERKSYPCQVVLTLFRLYQVKLVKKIYNGDSRR